MLFLQHGENAAQVIVGGLRSVFTDLESFCIFDRSGLVRAIPFFKRLSHLRGNPRGPVSRQPFLAIGGIRRHLVSIATNPWQPLIKLRGMCIERVDLLVKNRCDVNCNVGPECVWSLEKILEVEKYRILFQWG